jgi:ABC-type iron transport system FetAB ATPase subunit
MWLDPLPDQRAARSRVAEGQAMLNSVAQFDLTESLVRGHLRDMSGQVRCAICLARELFLLPGAIMPILATLAERQPPFATGPCGCGGAGLLFLLR